MTWTVRHRYYKHLAVFAALILTCYHLLIPARGAWFGHIAVVKPVARGSFIHKFNTHRNHIPPVIKILFWTPWFGEPSWNKPSGSKYFDDCPVSSCTLSSDKTEIKTSDAVIFHAHDLWNTFLGYSLPDFRKPDQVWIFFNQEPPTLVPLKYEQYNGVFNWTASYRTDSDVDMSYIDLKKLRVKKGPVGNIAATKTSGIAWIASNCADGARRQLLVKEIEKYLPVDKYGACGDRKLPDQEYMSVIKNHKFYLSFENSLCRDYITEKFTFPLSQRTIPVVSGGGDYESLAPPYSYIHVGDFANAKDLTDYLKYLDGNDTAYNSYFEWTRDYTIEGGNKWCGLCERLHDKTIPAQVYTDLAGFMSNDMCNAWSISDHISRQVYKFAVAVGIP